MNEFLDIFMKFRFSKWWYLLMAVVVVLLARILRSHAQGDNAQHERIRRTVQLTMLIALCGIILVFVGFLVFFGFTGDLASDLNMVMLTATGFVLLAIFLWSRLTRKQLKPEMEAGWMTRVEMFRLLNLFWWRATN